MALFSNSTDTEISCESAIGEAFIFADKEQLLRVFNNLLKNALQAIPKNGKGKIVVLLTKSDNLFLLQFKDNGAGIGQDVIQKIFTPNFTTKTGGTGLGLAMVKSIVETFNGKIWFETENLKGTTFFILLPAYKE